MCERLGAEQQRWDDEPGWYLCGDCGEDLYEGQVCECRAPSPDDDVDLSAFFEAVERLGAERRNSAA